MPTKIGTGFDHSSDPLKSTLTACLQVKSQLEDHPTDLALVFASPEYAKTETLDIIAHTLKPKRLVGSSTGAIIFSDRIVKAGIAIAGIASDDFIYNSSIISLAGVNDLHKAGFELARKITTDFNTPKREAFILFSNGVEKDYSHFVRGAQEVLGLGFPITGAISSDDMKYKHLNQFHQDQCLTNSAVGLLLGGDITVAINARHGFKPLGKPRTITSVSQYAIRTIDHKPAVQIYEHFIGKQLKPASSIALNSPMTLYPLGIYIEEDHQYLLRNAIDILPDGSIVCQGDVPEGAEVHLMISNKHYCRRSVTDAAESIKTTLNGKQAKLILIFESLARHKILGRSLSGEIHAIKDILGYNIPVIGMGSFGEIAPFGSLDQAKKNYLHNDNILIVALT